MCFGPMGLSLGRLSDLGLKGGEGDFKQIREKIRKERERKRVCVRE